MCENVKGLASHDNGKTLAVIKNTIKELGYTLVEPRVLKAVKYMVPQKRERIILVAIRNDYAEKVEFKWPSPYHRIMTLRDAFYKGDLYDTDVPTSVGQTYPEKRKRSWTWCHKEVTGVTCQRKSRRNTWAAVTFWVAARQVWLVGYLSTSQA